jgi:hypothetical protein
MTEVEKCFEFLSEQISDDARYEVTICQDTTNLPKKTWGRFADRLGAEIDAACENEPDTTEYAEIGARVDALCPTTLWEFKCVREFTDEHKMQLVLYAWLWQLEVELNGKRARQHFKLMNIRTGEVLEMIQDWARVEELVRVILRDKYKARAEIDDGEFIRK